MIETKRSVEGGRSASPEETRERILVATREVIGRKGKRGATTREIAEVAGVNEATLFRHFGTKESLLGRLRAAFLRLPRAGRRSGHADRELSEDLLESPG